MTNKIVLILLLTSFSTIVQAQDLYQLPLNTYSLGMGIGFAEYSKTLSVSLEYGILSDLEGSFSAGLEFVKESEPGISVPPSPIFSIGAYSKRTLGQTDLELVSVGKFFIESSKIVDDYTEETLTIRVISLSGGAGLTKKIEMESNVTISPFFMLINSQSWVTAKFGSISESESANCFSGQMGLDVDISTNVSLMGSVVFSFEDSNMAYSIYISFRPDLKHFRAPKLEKK